MIYTNLLHKEITDKILNCFYTVYNELGYGFLEKVYENAMNIELIEQGIVNEKQKPISVFYKGHCVGEYFADILADKRIIIELKANDAISPANELQLINYLKATDAEVGLLLNFGKKPEFKRKIFTNDKKKLSVNRLTSN